MNPDMNNHIILQRERGKYTVQRILGRVQIRVGGLTLLSGLNVEVECRKQRSFRNHHFIVFNEGCI